MRGGRVPSRIVRSASGILLEEGVAKHSLIWLHGLGGEAQHYVSFFSHSDSPVYGGCRVKLIQAPKRFTTLTQQTTSSWYDIRSLKRFTEPEETVFNFDHIRESCSIVKTHFDEEVAFWRDREPNSKIDAARRVYVGGMSQGGVMSLYFGLSASAPPGGAICFSGYLLKSAANPNLAYLPLLLVHGHRDATIREADARHSYSELLSQQATEYRTIKKLDHSVCLQQIGMMRDWLAKNHQKYEESVI